MAWISRCGILAIFLSFFQPMQGLGEQPLKTDFERMSNSLRRLYAKFPNVQNNPDSLYRYGVQVLNKGRVDEIIRFSKAEPAQFIAISNEVKAELQKPDPSRPADYDAKQPLNLATLVKDFKASKTRTDFVQRVTRTHKIDGVFSMFAVTDTNIPETEPITMVAIGDAVVAIGGVFIDIYIQTNDGKETIHLVVNEDKNGLHLNDQTATFIGPPKKGEYDPEWNPDAIVAMHEQKRFELNKRFADIQCLACHQDTHRRLAHADGHPRRFAGDENWIFRNPEYQARVQSSLQKKFDTFVSVRRDDPRFNWLWSQPEVVARGGKLLPEDTSHDPYMYRKNVFESGVSMFRQLTKKENWPENARAFAAAVQDTDNVDFELKKLLQFDDAELARKRASVMRLHAEKTLRVIKERNAQSMIYALKEGDPDKEKTKNMLHTEEANYLLINKHSIEQIGPEILNLIVSDEEWSKLSPREQETRVRLSDLDVRSLGEVKALVNNPAVQNIVKRRTDTHIVLEHMLGDKTKPLLYISTTRPPSAETGGHGIDLMNIYAAQVREDTPHGLWKQPILQVQGMDPCKAAIIYTQYPRRPEPLN